MAESAEDQIIHLINLNGSSCTLNTNQDKTRQLELNAKCRALYVPICWDPEVDL